MPEGTYDERGDELEEQVLRVVVRAVEREQDDLRHKLDGRGLDEDAQDGHEVALAVRAVRRRPLVRLPDPERHEAGRQAGLDDGDGVEGGDPVQEAGVKHTRVRVLGGVQTADGVARDWVQRVSIEGVFNGKSRLTQADNQ